MLIDPEPDEAELPPSVSGMLKRTESIKWTTPLELKKEHDEREHQMQRYKLWTHAT